MSQYNKAKLQSLVSGLSNSDLDAFVKHSLRTEDDGFIQELSIHGLWYKRKLKADGTTESLTFMGRDFNEREVTGRRK